MRVSSVRYEPLAKVYRLTNQKEVRAHRYCCLGPGDNVIVQSVGSACVKCSNGHAQILPVYTAEDSMAVVVQYALKTEAAEPQEVPRPTDLADNEFLPATCAVGVSGSDIRQYHASGRLNG